MPCRVKLSAREEQLQSVSLAASRFSQEIDVLNPLVSPVIENVTLSLKEVLPLSYKDGVNLAFGCTYGERILLFANHCNRSSCGHCFEVSADSVRICCCDIEDSLPQIVFNHPVCQYENSCTWHIHCDDKCLPLTHALVDLVFPGRPELWQSFVESASSILEGIDSAFDEKIEEFSTAMSKYLSDGCYEMLRSISGALKVRSVSMPVKHRVSLFQILFDFEDGVQLVYNLPDGNWCIRKNTVCICRVDDMFAPFAYYFPGGLSEFLKLKEDLASYIIPARDFN